MGRPWGHAKWNEPDREKGQILRICSHEYVESKKAKLIEGESRKVAAGSGEVVGMGRCWPVGTKLKL